MNAARRYRTTQATTASREEVLLMLYDGALRFLGEAIEAFRSGNAGYGGQRIGKVLAIISELQGSLDYRPAPDLCRTLDALYMFITQRLLEANQKREARPLEDVREIIAALHETWRQAAEIVRREQSQPASGDPSGGFRAEA